MVSTHTLRVQAVDDPRAQAFGSLRSTTVMPDGASLGDCTTAATLMVDATSSAVALRSSLP